MTHECACGAPAPTTTICAGCTVRLAQDLGDVPAYAAELQTTLTRQRAVTYGGSRSSETALPFNWRASEASWQLRSTLVGWIRELDPDDRDWPTGTVEAMSRWLLTRIHDLTRHPQADDAVDEIAAAMREVHRAIDNPPERLYAGPCGNPTDENGTDWCDTHLYAVNGRDTVSCPACGAIYAVTDRRSWLLDELEDHLLSAKEMAVALPGLGLKAVDSTIRSWAHRGRIQAKGLNLDGDPLYRCGDVRALYAAAEARDRVAT